MYKEKTLNLAPFVHFVDDEEGHATRLCLLKHMRTTEEGCQLHYSVVAGPRELVEDAMIFETDMKYIDDNFRVSDDE